MRFEPDLASLNSHRVPQWYDDAKFGIFIHWGLFSIPGFAAKTGSIGDAFREHYDGFCLWPSAVENRNQKNWTSPRDIVGELAKAVRARGLRFGVYYSGGI